MGFIIDSFYTALLYKCSPVVNYVGRYTDPAKYQLPTYIFFLLFTNIFDYS